MDAVRVHFQAGRLHLAEQIARSILAKEPKNAEAASILGIIAFRVGRGKDAIAWMARAVDGNPRVASFHSNLCEMFRHAGNREMALKAGENAIALDPSYAQAHNNLAIVHFDGGDLDRAEAGYRRAVTLAPDFAEGFNNLGNVLRLRGRVEEARTAFHRAMGLKANYVEAMSNCGGLLRDLGEFGESEKILRDAIRLRGTYVEAFVQLAHTLRAQKRDDDALGVLSRAVTIDPERAEAFLLISQILASGRKIEGAMSACRKALKAKPDHVGALNMMARLQRDANDLDGAIANARKALERAPESHDVLNNLGISLLENGDLAGAADALERAIRLKPQVISTYINLASARKFKPGDPEIEAMEAALLDNDSRSGFDRVGLHYAMGKVYDDIGEHEKAFAQFARGAALKRAEITYNEASTLRLFDRIRQVFTSKLIAEKSGFGDPDARPVFIVGMPRSGSTLIEQILSSHSAVHGAGEVKHLHAAIQTLDEGFGTSMRYPERAYLMEKPQFDAILKYYKAHMPMPEGKSIVTDKMLTNYFYVGLIYLLFPNARVIYSRRNAADTCLSCFSKLFREEMGHTYDLKEIAHYYRKCAGLMEYWKSVLPEGFILDVRYEDVVGDIEGQARRIVEHCGLPWERACVDFHKNERVIKTASVAQVRRPLYASSVERWRKYGSAVEPLIAELGDLTH
jgi:tetratricopeptide (TPR) repeat protein